MEFVISSAGSDLSNCNTARPFVRHLEPILPPCLFGVACHNAKYSRFLSTTASFKASFRSFTKRRLMERWAAEIGPRRCAVWRSRSDLASLLPRSVDSTWALLRCVLAYHRMHTGSVASWFKETLGSFIELSRGRPVRPDKRASITSVMNRLCSTWDDLATWHVAHRYKPFFFYKMFEQKTFGRDDKPWLLCFLACLLALLPWVLALLAWLSLQNCFVRLCLTYTCAGFAALQPSGNTAKMLQTQTLFFAHSAFCFLIWIVWLCLFVLLDVSFDSAGSTCSCSVTECACPHINTCNEHTACTWHVCLWVCLFVKRIDSTLVKFKVKDRNAFASLTTLQALRIVAKFCSSLLAKIQELQNAGWVL